MSISNLLNQTLTIYGQSSYDAYGRTQVGSGTDVKARVQPKTKRILSPTGDVVTIDAIAYVPASTTVDEDDKTTYDSVDYKVIAKYPTPNRSGDTSFIRLELQKWQA